MAWSRFWFEPRPAFGLHALRVLSGLLLLVWLLPLSGHQQAFFGLEGWFDSEAYVETAPPNPNTQIQPGPRDNPPPLEDRFPERGPLGWSVLYVATNPVTLHAFYWSTITIFVLFTLGVWPRITGILTWVMALSFLANATRYEADYLLVILAFYLMIAYVLYGQWSRPLTPFERVLGTWDGFLPRLFLRKTDEETPRSYAANLFVRVFQVHVAIIMVTSALHKLQFGYWWSGVAFWFPLHPPFATTAESLRTSATVSETYLFFLTLIQYLVLAWQLAFPVFAWRKSFRWLLLGGAAFGWLGTVLVLKQPLFGPFFFIACLSYLTPSEWQWVEGRVTQLGNAVAGWFRPQVAPKVKAPARS